MTGYIFEVVDQKTNQPLGGKLVLWMPGILHSTTKINTWPKQEHLETQDCKVSSSNDKQRETTAQNEITDEETK